MSLTTLYSTTRAARGSRLKARPDAAELETPSSPFQERVTGGVTVSELCLPGRHPGKAAGPMAKPCNNAILADGLGRIVGT